MDWLVLVTTLARERFWMAVMTVLLGMCFGTLLVSMVAAFLWLVERGRV